MTLRLKGRFQGDQNVPDGVLKGLDAAFWQTNTIM